MKRQASLCGSGKLPLIAGCYALAVQSGALADERAHLPLMQHIEARPHVVHYVTRYEIRMSDARVQEGSEDEKGRVRFADGVTPTMRSTGLFTGEYDEATGEGVVRGVKHVFTVAYKGQYEIVELEEDGDVFTWARDAAGAWTNYSYGPGAVLTPERKEWHRTGMPEFFAPYHFEIFSLDLPQARKEQAIVTEQDGLRLFTVGHADGGRNVHTIHAETGDLLSFESIPASGQFNIWMFGDYTTTDVGLRRPKSMSQAQQTAKDLFITEVSGLEFAFIDEAEAQWHFATPDLSPLTISLATPEALPEVRRAEVLALAEQLRAARE